MKKPFDYKVVDPSRRCKDCNAPLKKNLLARNPNADRCHTCDKLAGHSENFNRRRYLAKQKRLRTQYQ